MDSISNDPLGSKWLVEVEDPVVKDDNLLSSKKKDDNLLEKFGAVEVEQLSDLLVVSIFKSRKL